MKQRFSQASMFLVGDQMKTDMLQYLITGCVITGTSDDMDISLPIFSFSVWPKVVKVVSMARIIEIFCITRYQMKDMDILFPLVPHDQILVKWLSYSEPAKLGSFWWFSRFLSVAEIFSQTFFLT